MPLSQMFFIYLPSVSGYQDQSVEDLPWNSFNGLKKHKTEGLNGYLCKQGVIRIHFAYDRPRSFGKVTVIVCFTFHVYQCFMI